MLYLEFQLEPQTESKIKKILDNHSDKEVGTFPHHKHIVNKIEKSKEPLLEDILREIQADISRKAYL